MNEGQLLTIDVNATDDDSGDILTYAFTSLPEATGATIAANTGVFTWTPGYGQADTYSVNFTVTDGTATDYEVITLTVNDVNQPPILDSIGSKSVNEQIELTFTATATDPDGDTLTFSLTAAPTGASIGSSTGNFTWTPTEAQGPGEYTFTVKVTDNGTPALNNSEEITVTVNEVNVVPVLASIGDQSGDEGSPLSFTITATDADLPANTLTYFTSNFPSGATFYTGNRTFLWIPDYNQGGVYTNVHFEVNDGNLTDWENITITIGGTNRPPVLSSIGDKSVNEQTELNFTAKATDPDDDSYTFSLVGAPSGAIIDASTGTFTWTPIEAQGPNYYTFTVKVEDNQTPALSDYEEITVTVNEVNVAPTLLDVPATATINEMELYSFTATATDPDIPANALTFSLIDGPTGATIGGTSGVFSWNATEAQGGTGSDYAFKVRVTDDGAGTTLYDEESITLTVNEVNVAPLLVSIGNQDGNEGQELIFTINATDIDFPANTLTYSASNLPDGAAFYSSNRTFVWIPRYDQGGIYANVHFEVNDTHLTDSEDITITIGGTNRPPVLSSIGDKSVNEQTELNFTAKATDPDDDSYTFSLVGAPSGAIIDASTGTFTWTPIEAQGPNYYTFTVKVEDNQTPALSDYEEITVTVNEVNVAPVAYNDLYSLEEDTSLTVAARGILSNDTDAETPDSLTAIKVSNPTHGLVTLNSDGSFNYTPFANYTGLDYFTYKANDGMSDSNIATVEINVTPVNDAPVALGNTYTTIKNTKLAVSAPGVLENDNDVDKDSLMAIKQTGTTHGSLIFYANGSFTYQPNQDYTGTDVFTYKANDSTLESNNATVTISITVPVTPTPTQRPSGGGGGGGGGGSGGGFVSGGGSGGASLPAEWYICGVPASTIVTQVTGKQLITVNLTAAGKAVTVDMYRLSARDRKMHINVETEGVLTQIDESVTGQVKRVTLYTDPIVGSIEELKGDFQVTFSSTYDAVPPSNAAIKVTLAGPPSGELLTQFQNGAYRQGLEINQFAYTMNVRTLNVSPLNPVNLTMSVSPEWIIRSGGRSAVRVIRVTDDGTASILETKYTGSDSSGYPLFTAYSPDGFSTFGLVTLRTATAIPALPTIPTIIPKKTTAVVTTITAISNITAGEDVTDAPSIFIFAAIGIVVVALVANFIILRKKI